MGKTAVGLADYFTLITAISVTLAIGTLQRQSFACNLYAHTIFFQFVFYVPGNG